MQDVLTSKEAFIPKLHNFVSLQLNLCQNNSNLNSNPFFIEGVADKLAKYFSGHLVALWQNFGCNSMGSENLKIPERVSRHLVAFLVGVVSSNNEIYSSKPDQFITY